MNDPKVRLEATRARLRLAMTPPPEPERARASVGHDPSFLHKLFDMPAIQSAIHSVSAWWSHHPLRPIAQVANEASTAAVRPFARRNPYTLVLAAGAVGMGLAWSRPWRWIFRSALFAGLVPQLASRIVSRLPIESWISMAGAALRRPARPAGHHAVRSAQGT